MSDQTLQKLIIEVNSIGSKQDKAQKISNITTEMGHKLISFCEEETKAVIESSTTECLITHKDTITIMTLALINVLYAMLKNTKPIDRSLVTSFLLYMSQRTQELDK